MSFLDRIRSANSRDLTTFLPFEACGHRVGWVRPTFAELLREWPEVFEVDTAVRLSPRLNHDSVTTDSRSRALRPVLEALRERGVVRGWRDELYPVTLGWAVPPLLLMERAAVPFFGVRSYSVHVNGFVRRGESLHMWIARRSGDKPTYPGELDQVVAGGLPAGVSPECNLLKECAEEASIPADLARRARPVGTISYGLQAAEGYRPAVVFDFDLELPPDFVPQNADGEVEAFYLWPMERVIATVRDSHAFKFNCALVVIDFLVRRGFIPPSHADYVAITNGLHAVTP